MERTELLQRRLQRLEKQNVALKATVRRQESEISRWQVRAQQDRGAHNTRKMMSVVRDLQQRYEKLESDHAQANQRLAVFQHETFTLRSLVKFTDHPELANAARAEAERLVAKEEARNLKEQLRVKSRECDAFRTRCAEACDSAEALAAQVQCLIAEKERADERVQQQQQFSEATLDGYSCTQMLSDSRNANAVTTTTTANGGGSRHAEEVKTELSNALAAERRMVAELREHLEAERSRCAALEESAEALMTEKKSLLSAQRQPLSTSADIAARRQLANVKRLQRITKGANALLTARVGSLVEQNKGLLTRLAHTEEEMKCIQYRFGVAQATGSVHNR